MIPTADATTLTAQIWELRGELVETQRAIHVKMAEAYGQGYADGYADGRADGAK
jgi:flagellar biosynthesis/type III secretory pathway protein FliH